MGIGVSNHRLARAVARAGALGVVSGTAIDTVLVRRLQLGDESGEMRRALSHFPWPTVAERIVERYYIPGGKPVDRPFRLLPLPSANMARSRIELLVAANFVEVFLAKDGHDGLVGINYLEKIQVPTLPSLLGAILGNVDVVLMGAGIPLSIPGALDRLARFEAAEIRHQVEQTDALQSFSLRFDPGQYFEPKPLTLRRPAFLAIVSSHVIAKTLARKANGKVDGFVIEDHTAGGHNAPPRKARHAEPQAGPAFGPADIPDLAAFRALGIPFWIAGSAASAAKLEGALLQGAAGVQLGSAFAFCEESGILPELKRNVIAHSRAGGRGLRIVTDFEASPTGYPFKRLEYDADPQHLQALRGRERVCDLGYLRRAYARDGGLAYRCPGEPTATYLMKGGQLDDTTHKLCLCNQLLATIGLGQVRASGNELPLLTAGEDLSQIVPFTEPGSDSFTAERVLNVITGRRSLEATDLRPGAGTARSGDRRSRLATHMG